VPVEHLRLSDPITPEYQAEVDAAVARSEARYRRAEHAAARAHQRAERARAAAAKCSTRASRQELRIAEAELQLRLEEMQQLAAMMRSSPAAATHRGDHSYRPVPTPGDPL
jgi:hypothetical protein